MFDFLATPVLFVICVMVLCVAVYGTLHQIDLRRGLSLGLIEEKYYTDRGVVHTHHEMVRVGKHVRLMKLCFNEDTTKVSRLRILTEVKDQGSVRANLDSLVEATGLNLKVDPHYGSVEKYLASFQTA